MYNLDNPSASSGHGQQISTSTEKSVDRISLVEIKKKRRINFRQIVGRGVQYILEIRQRMREWFYKAIPGRLSWQILLTLAVNNLQVHASRTFVTVGAIAIGIGSMVFLLSFAYGLQNIVTKRIVQPNSFRLADVSSDSTALTLSETTINEIRNVSGVADVSPVISMAGSLTLADSRTDVVVLSVENKYFDYTHITPLAGKLFSEEADKRVGNVGYDLQVLLTQIENNKNEHILGVEDGLEIIIGQEIDGLRRAYKISEDVYVPVRITPTAQGEIIGYVKGSILETWNGVEVWGGTYNSIDTKGKEQVDGKGAWWGRWMKGQVPLYQELAPTAYAPLTDSMGSQIVMEGYIAEVSMQILAPEEVKIQKELDQILEDYEEKVLGEASSSALVVAVDSSASAELAAMVKEQEKVEEVAKIAVVEVAKQGGKEVVVSTGLLKTWNLEAKDVIGKEVTMEFIVSGGVIPGMTGRVLSQPVGYIVVGVIEESKQPLIYVPIADVESMGVSKYTFAKVLSDSDRTLAAVREKIEGMGFSTRSVVDTLLQVDRLFRVMRFLLGAFGLIALVVAIFGMFNTMTVSLLERTREIGVMKTLGTTDRDVIRIFIVESGIVGFMGGLIGIVGGVLGGWGVSILLTLIRGGKGVNLFYIPIWLLVVMIAVSVAVGIVTGIYPSKRAQKISALDALRYE